MKFNINAVDLGDFKKLRYPAIDHGDEEVIYGEDDFIETHCGGYSYVESVWFNLLCRKLTGEWTEDSGSESEEDLIKNTFYVSPDDPKPHNLTKEFPGRIDYNDEVIVGHGGGLYVG